MFIPSSRFDQAELIDILREMKMSLAKDHYYLPTQAFFFKESIIADSHLSSTILRVPKKHLRNSEFRMFLAQRTPLVITHLNDQLQLSWSPTDLTSKYGEQDCTAEDCEGRSKPVTTTLGSFLGYFTEDSERRDGVIWKVKVKFLCL